MRSWMAPGSRMRTWLRVRLPWLRRVVLAPGRWWRSRRWRRRHHELSIADRSVLEGTILPAVRDEAAGGDVLFVGVEWYTASYPSMFSSGNLVTLDIDPALARHGSSRHIVGDVCRLADYVAPGSLAAVVCNGVLGYGVDEPRDVDRALRAFAASLRPNGILVIGWNDVESRRVEGLDAAASRQGLVRAVGAGLPEHRTEPIGPLRHVYEVYRRQ